jgi:hypothetical protein
MTWLKTLIKLRCFRFLLWTSFTVFFISRTIVDLPPKSAYSTLHVAWRTPVMQVPEYRTACTRSSMAAFSRRLHTMNIGCLRTVPFDDYLMAARCFLLHPFSWDSPSLIHSLIQDFFSSESLSLSLLTLPFLSCFWSGAWIWGLCVLPSWCYYCRQLLRFPCRKTCYAPSTDLWVCKLLAICMGSSGHEAMLGFGRLFLIILGYGKGALNLWGRTPHMPLVPDQCGATMLVSWWFNDWYIFRWS